MKILLPIKVLEFWVVLHVDFLQMNKLLFLVLILLPVCNAFGQISFGLKAGTNFSTVDFQRRPEFTFREVKLIQNYQYGAIFRYADPKHFGVQFELNHIIKGWKDVNDTSNVEYRRTIDYLEMPVLSHFYIGSGKVRIIIELGFYVAYALSSEETYFYPDTDQSTTSEYILQEGIDNRWDYGLLGQGGLQYNFPFGAFHVEAFFSFGYGSIFLDKAEELETSPNRVYGLTFGYVHHLKKYTKE